MRFVACVALLTVGGCFASPFKQTIYNNSGREVAVEYNGRTHHLADHASLKTRDTGDSFGRFPQFVVRDAEHEWRYDKTIGYVGCEWPPMGACQRLQLEPDGAIWWVGGGSNEASAYGEPPAWQPPVFPLRGR